MNCLPDNLPRSVCFIQPYYVPLLAFGVPIGLWRLIARLVLCPADRLKEASRHLFEFDQFSMNFKDSKLSISERVLDSKILTDFFFGIKRAF